MANTSKRRTSSFQMRVSTPHVHCYSRGVKIGNWFEDECKYIKQQHRHQSMYNSNFSKPKIYHVDYTEIYKPKFKALGLGARTLMWNGDKFLQNFATTYDLTYRYFKNGLSGPLPKKNRIELIENFGNVSKYDYEISSSFKNREDEDNEYFTEYRKEFLPPKPLDYEKSPFRRSNKLLRNKFSLTTVQMRPIKKPVIELPNTCVRN